MRDIHPVTIKNEKGEIIWLDLDEKKKGSLHIVPKGNWKVSIWGVKPTGQKVKRAAPGGEGLVMDYFNEEAVIHYLNYFDSVLIKHPGTLNPRAFYHDSYEVFGAD